MYCLNFNKTGMELVSEILSVTRGLLVIPSLSNSEKKNVCAQKSPSMMHHGPYFISCIVAQKVSMHFFMSDNRAKQL